MVLQRAPAKAAVYGQLFQAGARDQAVEALSVAVTVSEYAALDALLAAAAARMCHTDRTASFTGTPHACCLPTGLAAVVTQSRLRLLPLRPTAYPGAPPTTLPAGRPTSNPRLRAEHTRSLPCARAAEYRSRAPLPQSIALRLETCTFAQVRDTYSSLAFPGHSPLR